MKKFLRNVKDNRKLRLFAVACCRKIAHLVNDPKCQNAIETAELFADDLVDAKILANARFAAYGCSSYNCSVVYNATCIIGEFAYNAAVSTAYALHTKVNCLVPLAKNLIHPYPIASFPPNIQHFANLIYFNKEFCLLPVLADMLEDNYFTEPLLLQHLRSTDTIYKGWWSLDVVRNA
jgi:hypothetical protein